MSIITHTSRYTCGAVAHRRNGVGAPANDTTALSTIAAICFPTLNGLPYFLVMRHLLEVCPLSRGAKVEPLSTPLQSGLRFLQHPLPAPPSAHLAVCFPEGKEYGLTTFYMYARLG